MATLRTFRAFHAGFVSTMVALGIYVLVPQFKSLFTDFGAAVPALTRLLFAIYPYAFVFPVVAVAMALLAGETSRARYWVVPLVYTMSAVITSFTVMALYLPVFRLAALEICS